MKKDLLSIVKFFSLAIVFLAFSFSVNAEGRGLKNLTDSSKAEYSRFAPAPFKTDAAYKYRAVDFGNALNFDGADDFVTLSPTGITFPNNEWTQELWIYLPTSPYSTYSIVIGCDDMGNWSKRCPFLMINAPNGIHGGFGYGTAVTTQAGYHAYNTLTIGAWNHVAQTYDGTAIKAYVNGTLVANVNAASLISNANPVKYLSNLPDVAIRFRGSMDEVRFWKRARTEAEIKANYNKTVNATDPDLLLYYSFNQGVAGGDNKSVSVVTDNTGNFPGSLNNFTLDGATSNFVGSFTLEVPTANSASNITEGSFVANWTAPSGVTVNNYILEVAKDANFISLVAGYNNLSVPAGTTSWQVTGLTPDFNYYYRVKAVIGAATSVSSNVISVKTLLLNGLGNYLNFAGGVNYLSISNGGISFPNNEWTEEMWVYVPSSIGGGFVNLLVTNTISSATAIFRGPSMYIINKTRLHAGYGDGVNWKVYTTSKDVFQLDAWTHVAQTFDGTTIKVYVNGVFSEAINMPGTSNVNKIHYVGGAENAPTHECFLGNIDELRIWKRALTAAEIESNYKIPIDRNSPGAYQSLIAYYDFNQGIAAGDNIAINNLIDNKNAYDAEFENINKTGSTSNFLGKLKLTPPVANAASEITSGSFRANWAMGAGSSPTPNKYFLDVSTDATFADAGKFAPGYLNKDVGNVTKIDVTGLNPSVTYYYRLRAGYADPWYHPSVNSNTTTATTLKANTITLAATDLKTYGDAPYQLAVSSSGTGAYTYTVSSGDAVSINNTGQVTILKAGVATIVVTQEADAVYGSGGPVTQTITVQPLGLKIIFKVADKEYDGSNAASITSTSGTSTAYGDAITIHVRGGATFDNKDVGVDKPITVTGVSISGAKASNYILASVTTWPASITAKPVKIILTANNKKYDGNAVATGSLIVDGVITGDNVTASAGSINFADKNVGVGKLVTATGISLSSNNYVAITSVTSTANITAKEVTVTFKANNKVFDNTTTATGILTVTNLEAGDAATAMAAAMNFADANIGVNKTVTATGISINNANYTPLNTTATSTANITGKSVTVTINQVASKVYDGATTASATFNITGLAAGETVTVISADVSFADKNAGVGKPVTATNFKLSDANYSAANSSATSTGNITAKKVTVTFKANNKVFDNTTTATGVLTVTNLEAGDAVTATAAAMNFADANIGVNKTVTATGISINNANYAPLNTTATSTANITGKSVTVTINQVASKVYDGATTASATFNITGLAAGETVTVTSADVSFADKNAGLGKPVTATNFKLSDANYSAANSSATSTGNITAKGVTVTFKANNKVFDNTTTATGVLTVTNLVAGDAATAMAAAMNFADANIGANKTVTATGISINNANYAPLNTAATSTANITGKSVTVTINQVADKVYDGATTASATFNITGLAAGETVTVISADVSFADKNVGLGKPVTATNFKLSDVNYSAANSSATSTGNITAKPVKIILTVNDKEYDGSPTASGSIRVFASDLISGETITATAGSITFADKNAGSGKPVTATGISLSNNNYVAITPVTSTANITAKGVTITFQANNKPFDGNNSATGSFTIIGQIAGDDVKATANSILFDNANTGANKLVTASGISLTGSAQANYRPLNTTATSTANIGGKSVTVTINQVASKVYDGATTASATFNITGLAAGETVTVISADVSFADKNAGLGKPVTATNFKLSDANYSAANSSATSTGNITAKGVTVTFKANNKVFDNTTTATGVLTVTNLVAGDAATATATAMNFADANIGANKTVTATGISINNANYAPLNTTATATANIGGKGVTITINQVADKVYDGATTASATFNITGLAAGETVTVISADVSFADKNVGLGKPVTATNFKLSDVNYSAANSSATSTGNITAKPVKIILTANDKEYDGSPTASGAIRVFAPDLISGETITATAGSITFADKNAGSGKPVTATGISLSDNNYVAITPVTSTANITAKGVTITFQANNKPFDGNNVATGSFTIIGQIAGDDVKATANSILFDNANTGANKLVTASGISLTGSAQANYRPLNTTATSTANIGGKSVTVTINQVASKVYDGATTASATFNITGLAAGETVTVISADVSFADKNAGLGKPVTATNFKLSDANYSAANSSATSTGNITAKGVTVTFKANNKVFDNTTTATGVLTVTNLEAGDAATATATAMNFADANIGANKTVTATGISINNANYAPLNTTATATANIGGKGVMVTINQVADKVYDGATTASATFNITGLAAGETVTVISADVSFADKNVGLGKPVTATNFRLSDVNYSAANSSATSTGNITAKPVKIILTVNDKEYDGSPTASGSIRVFAPDLISGETITATAGSITFADKNAGSGKPVTATGISLSNNNYVAITPVTSTANITAKGVTITFQANNKPFDGNNVATGSFTIIGQIAGDDVKATANSILFDNANTGANKLVTASGISLTGSAQANYRPLNTTATSTANIGGKSVTVTINQVASKVYDGVTTASATFNITGLAAGETVTVISADVSFADKNVGLGKPVTATNFRLSDANYSAANSSATSTGNITPKNLIITADNKTKLPGEDNPPLTADYNGFVSGENNTNALTVQPLITTTATKTSPPGNYPIEVSGAVAANNNYNVIYNKGILTISTVVITALNLNANTLYANSQTGTLAGTLTASSTDPNAIYAYSLVPGAVDNDKFIINDDKLYTNTTFNYAVQSTFTIRVQVSTQSGGMLTKDFMVVILYVNSSPTLDAIPNQSVCATTESHTINLSGITPGSETDQTTSLSISSDREDMFNALSVASLAGGKGIISYSLKAEVSGSAVVTVTVKDNGGTANGGVDTYSVSFTINTNALPVISISTSEGKLKVIRGRTLELTANAPEAIEYSWADAKGIISDRNSAKLTIQPTENTTYTVKATTAAGCVEVKQINIEVGREYSDVVANNIITPNGDGVNDLWVIENIERYPNATVKVFDIARRLVFSQIGYDNKWNGYFNGKPLHEGAYYYVIDFGANLYKAKGCVTIINEQ